MNNEDFLPRIQFTAEDQERIKPAQGNILGGILSDYGFPKDAHMPSVCSAIGALLGFSVTHAIRRGDFITDEMLASPNFLVTFATNRGTFYVGDCPNLMLVSNTLNRHAPWNLIMGCISGPSPAPGVIPDLSPIFRHTAQTAGSDKYGIPNLPPEYMPREMPLSVVERWWPTAEYDLQQCGYRPIMWPLALGYIATIAVMGTPIVSQRTLAARIVMEAAIPMSKIDPRTITFRTMT